jgi:DNA polymerase III epsilon subunit-like protein
MQLTPFEQKNIVFFDTEFSDLDPYTGELLSVGMVTLDGRELYIELEHSGPTSDWVKKHIIPQLNDEKLTKEQARDVIEQFLEGKEPFAVAFVDNYDVIYLTKLFGAGKLPFKWMTIDFASILFASGINPVKFQRDVSGAKDFYKQLGIDISKYKNHHALDDARLLRDVWSKVVPSATAD